MIDSIVRGHDLPTSPRATKALFKIISEHKTAKNFYDLGCAHGTLALRIKRKFPTLCVYAIDNNSVRIFFAKIRTFLFRQNIKFLRKDIFDVNLSNADIVYTYLWYDTMPPLEKKLQRELKQGAIVITNTSNFPTWKPIQKIVTYHKVSKMPDFETLFVYQKT
ncbi:MAG: class I SAM-dependent methyltransferase [Patescibacteria group bacterium]|nr:class I SAM-dependent methyltransferase [Patescibacteria group bacterium]